MSTTLKLLQLKWLQLCFISSKVLSKDTALRSSSQADFVVTKSIREFVNRALALTGPAERNKLLVFIRKSSSLPLFKTNLKTYSFKLCHD